MGADDDVVVVDDEIADGSGWQIHFERLPMVAVIPRDVDGALGSGEEQALAPGIFTDRVHRFIFGQAGGDLLPGLARVVCAVDVRVQVVEAKSVDGGVDGIFIEMRGVELGDLAPGGEIGRSDVLPVFAGVCGDVDKAIVGADPDDVLLSRRGRDRVNDAAVFALRGIVGNKLLSEVRGNAGIFARQVGTDFMPAVSVVVGGEEYVRSEIEGMRAQG